MLFQVKYHSEVYKVFGVTNKGNEHDKFLIYKDHSFKWVYISACELT